METKRRAELEEDKGKIVRWQYYCGIFDRSGTEEILS
jgi:hypothetical protein